MARRIRRWMPVTFAVALASTGFAFMASNTVPATNAGTAENVISGYTASNVHYKMATSGDPEEVKGVTFHLVADNPPTGGAPAPATVAIELKNDAGTYSCAADGPWAASAGDFKCVISPTVDVASLIELTVIAAQ